MIPAWILLVVLVVGAVWMIIALALARRLYRWERNLRGVRVQINYKGRAKMTPRLFDWLLWANQLESDKRVNGQVIYSQGGTTIMLRKPNDHGKATTKTIKEPAS